VTRKAARNRRKVGRGGIRHAVERKWGTRLVTAVGEEPGGDTLTSHGAVQAARGNGFFFAHENGQAKGMSTARVTGRVIDWGRSMRVVDPAQRSASPDTEPVCVPGRRGEVQAFIEQFYAETRAVRAVEARCGRSCSMV